MSTLWNVGLVVPSVMLSPNVRNLSTVIVGAGGGGCGGGGVGGVGGFVGGVGPVGVPLHPTPATLRTSTATSSRTKRIFYWSELTNLPVGGTERVW